MCSRCLSLLLAFALLAGARTLRVCADPNNLPFSNEAGEGFENRLAQRVARDLGATLEYRWWSQREHSVSRSLKAGVCDVLFGVPTGMEGVLSTRPYYTSSYVFVSRQDRDLNLSSLLDERLPQLRIGVQVVGEDYAPPAVVLARRGLSENIIGFTLYGNSGEADPQARILDALRKGEIDVAIAWGPVAGYFAATPGAPLEIHPVSPAAFSGVPFTFAISAAVRRDQPDLEVEVDRALLRECSAIQALVKEYRVPSIVEGSLRCDSQSSSPVALR